VIVPTYRGIALSGFNADAAKHYSARWRRAFQGAWCSAHQGRAAGWGRMKYRLPEIFPGVFLAVAIFAMGMLFASSIFPPTIKPEVEAQKHSKQEVSKASTDERIADYTWWRAVLTGGLVFVAFGQGVFIARSDKTARIAANAADLSARAAVAIELPIIRADPYKFNYGSSMDGEPDNPRIGSLTLARSLPRHKVGLRKSRAQFPIPRSARRAFQIVRASPAQIALSSTSTGAFSFSFAKTPDHSASWRLVTFAQLPA